jgi:predicted ATPase
LASLAEPGLVPQTVAAALGEREEPHRPLTETLADALRPRSLLLLLDNCEHLLSACAQLAETLLQRCPNLRLLATSREGLRIAGETTYRVPPLSLPDLERLPRVAMLTQSEAVQLFVDRATASLPSFTLTEQNGAAVAQVCRQLDGIPLAIELAAARVKALPIEIIGARLDDMFRLLIGGSRTALPRHQTLQATIDWSHALLSEPERALFRRLSVFAGGFTLEAAEAVCAQVGEGERDFSSLIPEDVLDLLTSLVEKSLVQYHERDGEARYRLLEPVRQYAGGRLIERCEAEGLRNRHLEFYLQLAERAEPELLRHAQIEWLDRLEREHDNLRAALEWSHAEADSAEPARSGWSELRLAGALKWFWIKRSHFHEGHQRVEGALSRGGEAPALARVKALLAAGMLAHFPGDYLGGDQFFEEALALARAAGHPWGVALGLLGLGMGTILSMFAMASRQECERAGTLAEEALAVARHTEDRWLIACTLRAPGFVAELRGDYPRATACFDEMLALSREVGDAWNVADALCHLARLADYQGNPERARALFQEGLVLCRLLEEQRAAIACLTGLAELAAIQQQAERAARLWGAAEALCEASHNARAWAQAFWHASHDQNVAAARAALGEQAFEAAWEAGRALTLEEAIRLALESPASSGDDE